MTVDHYRCRAGTMEKTGPDSRLSVLKSLMIRRETKTRTWQVLGFVCIALVVSTCASIDEACVASASLMWPWPCCAVLLLRGLCGAAVCVALMCCTLAQSSELIQAVLQTKASLETTSQGSHRNSEADTTAAPAGGSGSTDACN